MNFIKLLTEVDSYLAIHDAEMSAFLDGIPEIPEPIKPKPVMFRPIAALQSKPNQPVKAKPVHQQRQMYVAKAGEIIL